VFLPVDACLSPLGHLPRLGVSARQFVIFGKVLTSVEYGLSSVFYCPILFRFILFLKVFYKIFLLKVSLSVLRLS
jgi:hypothetical protein